MPVNRRCLAQCLGLLVAAFMCVPGARAQRASLPMSAAKLPSGATDLGVLAGSQPMRLTMYLQPAADRQAALIQFLSAVQTPGNAAYRQWVTPAVFGQKFGATTEQVAAVTAFAQASGLKVESASASGLRIVVSGTAAQVEAAMSPSLHAVQMARQSYYANSAAVSLPVAMMGSVVAVGGLSNLPSEHPLMLGTDGAVAGASSASDALAELGAAVEANTSRLISLSTTTCLEDVDAGSQTAMQLALRQASAQGVIVLAQTGCGARGSAGFPSVLSEATSVALAPGITVPTTATLSEARPSWQLAMGLPADGLRHEPDVTVSSLSAMAQTMMSILATSPAGADGSLARLGNVNATLYELASEPGLYTQPDGAAAGTWEAATGLGLVDLQKLDKFFPRGSLADNVSISVSNNGYATHGTAFTFTSTVTDTSGQGGGVVPTQTVTFATTTGVALGSGMLSGGTTSVSNNTLPGGTYNVVASYSGDGTYAANNSVQAGFTVAPEAAQVTATASSAVVGGTTNVVITVKSLSGVGTPSGTVTVAPQGTSDTSTYAGTLSGSGGTATATVAVPAVQGGADVFKTNCTTDTTFTCYSPVDVTAQIGLGTPTMVMTASPTTVVTGTTETLTATVSGKGGLYPMPAGNVNFFDNGVSIGPATLNNGVATIQKTGLSGTVAHSFTSSYDGDNNYGTAAATAGTTNTQASATSLVLNISPFPPVSGSTASLAAVLTYTLTNSTAPVGTVSFYEDGVLLATEPVVSGTATYTSTGLSSTTTHQYYAVFAGDTNYLTSTSPTVTTPVGTASSATTTTLTVSPNPPVSGSLTTLTAAIGYTGTTAPTGTVSFYEDNAVIGSGTVSGAVATFTSTTLSSSIAHSFFAVYNADANYKTSTSATVTTAATGVVTTTTLTVSPNPPVGGSTTTLSATIGYTANGLTPTGTMSFYEDGVLLTSVAVNSLVVSYSSTTLTGTAAHTFYAVYGGDTNFKTSTSPGVATSASTATVTTTTALTISPNPPVSGSLTTLTATIGYTGTTAPTGTVTFYEDGAVLTTGTVSGGVATLSGTTFNTTAAHTYYAVYGGDATYKASTSPTVSVAAAPTVVTTVSLLVSPNPPVSGSLTTLTATIGYTGTTAPTGMVTFYEDSAALASSAVSAGVATYTSTVLSGKTSHVFYAAYSGDGTFKTSTSSTTTTPADTTTSATTVTVASSAPSVATGGTVTLSAVITPASIVNSMAPTGTVTFSSAQGVLCTSAVSSNAASCVATLTTAGTQTISAAYGGDTNYQASTSTTPATVTVGSTAAGTLMVTASPSVSVKYGNTVTLSATLTPTTALSAGPAGSVTFTLSGTAAATYTAQLVAAGTTSSTATVAIPAPIPGTYTVTATCTSTNVVCTGLSATASLVTIKGDTVTTLSALPTSPLAGESTTFTATVAPALTANAAALTPTGTVTFFINGTATVETLVNGTATFTTVLTATTGNYVTAVYSGDTNWNGSTSSQLIVNIAPIVTTATLTANETTALYTANIVLSATILAPATATNPNPAAPFGTVMFYDLYNGQTVPLGPGNLTQLIMGQSIAQLSTTGLMKGTHNITALYAANTTFASSTASIVINITDYGVTLSPSTLSLSPGAGGASIATVTSYNGFAGQVVLGCTPPAGSSMTCSFSPAVITGSGTSILSVTTTAAKAAVTMPLRPGRATGISLAAVSLGTLLLGLLVPRRRMRPGLPLAVLAAGVLGVSMGCSTQGIVTTPGSPTGTGTSGTPQGTQLLSIFTSGTDGQTTVRHDSQFQVTVQ